MPGMQSGLNLRNPLLVAAFRSALLHQGMIALLVFGVLALGWISVREWRPVGAGLGAGRAAADPEPSWRMLLRVGFGLLWLLDGLLQAQPSMVVGLPARVIQPAAASSPAWVQHLVNWAGTSWSYHPVQAAAATVWIQAGIGCWMLAARRGRWSQLAGLAGLAWGLIVWVFGESFGGIFAPGLTWLFGAPGAAVFYCVAGGLIALPSRYWRAPGLGRAMLAALGLFFAGMAVLQAWPGRGFWPGRLAAGPGTLTDMINSMAQAPQPGFLAGWVRWFGSLTAAHGFAVNLFAVVALALIAAALLTGAALPGTAQPGGTARPTGAARAGSGAAAGRRVLLIRLAIAAAVLLCLADWVLVEDLGVFGGLGTDPNSMIPMALLLAAGYLAFAGAPASISETENSPAGVAPQASATPAADVASVARVAAATEVAPAGAVDAPTPRAVDAPAGSGLPAATAAAAVEAPSPDPQPASPAAGVPAGAGVSAAGETPPGPAAGRAGDAGAGGRPAVPGPPPGWRGWLSPGRLTSAFGAADVRTIAAAWALGVTIIGAFPLAAAAANRSADPVIARAIDGSAAALNFQAPGFRLTDQDGRPVSLASLRGKVVLLTFLDPVCTSDCPLIAQEFRQAGRLLGASSRDVELVAIAANPVYHTTAYTRAFDQQEGLASVPNWKFLSGPLPALKRVWHDYYFSAEVVPAGGMVLHGDVAYVIDAAGRTRTELNFNPGPGTAASVSSFAAELAAAAIKAMRSS
jgi:cytochrome oxidase Cu insertion factor (SCO1/SenC/PrrC family)